MDRPSAIRSAAGWLLAAAAAFLFAGMTLAASDGRAPPAPPEPDAADWERLRAGEVLVRAYDNGEAGGAAEVTALFHAAPATIWQTLEDCEANFRFVVGLEVCEVEIISERYAKTRQVVNKPGLVPRTEFRFESIREPHRWVVIHGLSGDLEILEGSWRFDPVEGDDAVLVRHEIRVKPRFPTPRWLVRRTRDTGDLVACLRAVVDGSGDPRQLARDRERCP